MGSEFLDFQRTPATQLGCLFKKQPFSVASLPSSIPMPETFLLLLVGHLLGDFVFQPTRLVRLKRRMIFLLLHAFIVAALGFLLLGLPHPVIFGILFLTHALIDFCKSRANPESARAFILDQLAHVAVIAVIAALGPTAARRGFWPDLLGDQLPWFHTIACLAGGLILIGPAGGILIGLLTRPFSREISAQIVDNPRSLATGDDAYLAAGLKHGGKVIGWLERLLALLFILSHQPTALGFLITAKSILRFGEIKDARHRKVAEYIIIGTFLSFAWAIVVALLVQAGLDHWRPPAPIPRP